MPSAFDDLFAATCSPLMANAFGERITYTPLGGVAKRVTAILEWKEGVGETNREDGRIFRKQVAVQVQVTDCPSLAAGDKFTIEDVDYRVDHIPLANSAGWATASAIRIEQRDKGRRDRLLPTGNG